MSWIYWTVFAYFVLGAIISIVNCISFFLPFGICGLEEYDEIRNEILDAGAEKRMLRAIICIFPITPILTLKFLLEYFLDL